MIEQILKALGNNATIEVGALLELLTGQAVSIPIKPEVQPIGNGKNLIIALDKNAVTLQIQ